jgi:hypothetical protein
MAKSLTFRAPHPRVPCVGAVFDSFSVFDSPHHHNLTVAPDCAA